MKSFVLLVFLILITRSFSVADATLEETCKKATTATADYNFCVTSLQAAPESRTADTKALAVIATNLTIANYTHNLARIAELLNLKGLGHQVKQALSSCSGAYSAGVSDLKMAAARIESDDVDAGLVSLSEGWKRPGECKDALRRSGGESMMREEDGFASRLITLALKIAVLQRNTEELNKQ